MSESMKGAAGKKREANIGVGIAFFGMAIAMGISMDNWAFALPFAVLAVVFMFPSTGGKAEPEAAPDAAD